VQEAYNREHGITPESVRRALDELLSSPIAADYSTVPLEEPEGEEIFDDAAALEAEVRRLEREMVDAAERLEFEVAAARRDRIRYLREKAVVG
jgi:excinuclease ABC subunit B